MVMIYESQFVARAAAHDGSIRPDMVLMYPEPDVLSKHTLVPLTSKGDRGIVSVETKGINQRGEEVCYFRRKVMVWTRETAPARGRPYDSDALWSDSAER